MNHARNSNSGVVPKDTVFVDRKIEEDDEGEAVKERGETKEAEWELEHDLGGAFLSEHKFISFCVCVTLTEPLSVTYPPSFSNVPVSNTPPTVDFCLGFNNCPLF